jgi:23S rRNA (uridine2552-2'-O)-methyltransferase
MYRIHKKDEFYTRMAHEEGYPARSVYKLKEMDEKFRLFRIGDKVLDLGCAPGSWMMYISEKIGNSGKVVGVDRSELKIPLKDNMQFVEQSVMDLKKDDFAGMKFDLVVSDLAPQTTGIKISDEVRSVELCDVALDLAVALLLPDGNFVCKIFEGEMIRDFHDKIKARFKRFKIFKPKAVIKGSKEIYLLGFGVLPESVKE